MRLLRLAAGKEPLDLHPLVTVADPDGALAEALRAAVAGLPEADARGADGLLEAHGVRFPLRSDLLAMLDIDASVQPIVVADDVPVRPATPAALALAAAEAELAEQATQEAAAAAVLQDTEEEVERAEGALAEAQRTAEEAATATRRIEALDDLAGAVDRLTERRRQIADELEQLRPDLRQAEARRAQVEEDHADVRERRRLASERRASLADELAAVEAELAPHAADEVMAAQERLRSLEAEIEAEREAAARREDDAAQAEHPAERVAAIEARLEELERSLAALAPIEAAPVQRALARLVGVDRTALVAEPQAVDLADELEALSVVASASVEVVRPLVDPVQARIHLDEARQAVLEAEQSARKPELDPDLVDQLEQAHSELLDALDRADSRFGGRRAERRVEECRVAENDLLGRLRFASYSAYMMGSPLGQPDPERGAALAGARAALGAAEATWRRVQDQTDAELARAEALDRRRTLLERAEELLGASVPLGEVVGALRAHRVPSITEAEARSTLVDALDEVGLVVGDDELETDDLVQLAGSLLEEVAAADARHHDIMVEQRSLLDERSVLKAALSADTEGPGVGDPSSQERVWAAQLDDAATAVEVAQHRVESHAAAAERRTALVDELQSARREEDAAAEAAQAEEERLRSHLSVVEAQQVETEAQEADANQQMRHLSEDSDVDPERLADDVRRAEADLQDLIARRDTARAAWDQASLAHATALAEAARHRELAAAEGTGPVSAEESEWYLLARLASQRSVSLAGGLPMLLDRALDGLDGPGVRHVLDRLARMAETVQIIVLSDHAVVRSWAQEVGATRAGVVSAA